MSDLISRQAALDCFHAWIDRYGDVHTPDEMPEYRAIEAVPSAEPERKTGRWIDKDGGLATCSVCGDRWGVWSVMNFCPTCGARMEVKDE